MKTKTLTIKTVERRQIIDITEEVDRVARETIQEGLCHLFVAHTTAALTTADLDPGTDLDMLDAFSALVPKLKFRHPHDPAHVPDHILSSLIGSSIVVPVKNGGLILGQWQRIVLVEFSGPRSREVVLTLSKQ